MQGKRRQARPALGGRQAGSRSGIDTPRAQFDLAMVCWGRRARFTSPVGRRGRAPKHLSEPRARSSPPLREERAGRGPGGGAPADAAGPRSVGNLKRAGRTRHLRHFAIPVPRATRRGATPWRYHATARGDAIGRLRPHIAKFLGRFALAKKQKDRPEFPMRRVATSVHLHPVRACDGVLTFSSIPTHCGYAPSVPRLPSAAFCRDATNGHWKAPRIPDPS
jgi:hypothetical protein